MKNLSPTTVLQRVPEVTAHVQSNNTLLALTKTSKVQCGPHGLAVLDAFYLPRTLGDALDELKSRIRGSEDWIELTNNILRLYECGVLREPGRQQISLGLDPQQYDAAPSHIVMLDDRTRTEKFIAGIREAVRPDDVVVDIGTGTGVLAIAAARAGARHVYAIEAGGIGQSARTIFEANSLSHRITLVQGWSTQVRLPERCDVLVSEMIGDDPLAEQVLTIVADAKKRLLKDDARLVPWKARLRGVPTEIPPAELARYTFTAENVQRWKNWYQIDFDPLVGVAANSPHPFLVDPYFARNWPMLSDSVVLADVDFRAESPLMVESVAPFTAKVSGSVNGLILYFELELSDSVSLSTQPRTVDKNNHWHTPLWILTNPIPVQIGDQIQVTYRHCRGRTWLSLDRI